jgi:hypothetical protein
MKQAWKKGETICENVRVDKNLSAMDAQNFLRVCG